MNQLTKYDAARYALSVAVEVDEVKDIRDKAEAMAAYARQAKDTELVQWATEIKVRAERRAGQMLAEMPKATGKAGQFTGGHTVVPPVKEKTLSDIGITKNESSRWQKLAAVSDTQFEQAVAAAKEVAGEVTTAAMLRAARAQEPAKSNPPAVVADQQDNEGTPDEAEFDSLAAAEKAEEMAMRLLLASDEPLADVTEKYKQSLLQIEQLTARIVGLQNQSTHQIKTIKSLQAKLKKLEQAA